MDSPALDLALLEAQSWQNAYRLHCWAWSMSSQETALIIWRCNPPMYLQHQGKVERQLLHVWDMSRHVCQLLTVQNVWSVGEKPYLVYSLHSDNIERAVYKIVDCSSIRDGDAGSRSCGWLRASSWGHSCPCSVAPQCGSCSVTSFALGGAFTIYDIGKGSLHIRSLTWIAKRTGRWLLQRLFAFRGTHSHAFEQLLWAGGFCYVYAWINATHWPCVLPVNSPLVRSVTVSSCLPNQCLHIA